jgi:hypothetical protein
MAATVWNDFDAGYYFDVYNSGLSAGAGVTSMLVAVKGSTGEFWIYNPLFRRWNASGSANPATGTGGWTVPSIGGAIYAAVGLYEIPYQVTFNFGATPMINRRYIPSGYSTWHALKGTTTLDPGFAAANLALSNGNLTATATAASGGWNAARSTTTIGSGDLAVFEMQMFADNGTFGIITGVANSGMPTGGFPGISGGSAGLQEQGALYGASGGGDGYGLPGVTNFRSVRANNAKSSGKWAFETHIDAIASDALLIGFADASADTDMDIGQSVHSVGWQPSTGKFWTNGGFTGPLATAVETPGAKPLILVDVDSLAYWVYSPSSGRYNGSPTANPATNTGGFPISTFTGGVYPAVGLAGLNRNCAITANFSAAPASPLPSGFAMWDPAPAGGVKGIPQIY